HHYNPHYLPSVSWTYPATTRILFEAGVNAYIINQLDKREPGVSQNDIGITDQGLNLMYGNIPTRTLPRRQYQARLAVSHVTGSPTLNTRRTGTQVETKSAA